VLEALQRLAPAVLRHLLAYGELLFEEGGDALRQSRRRAVAVAVTAGAALISLSLACVWAIAVSWDGPYRLVVIGALCLGFALVALIGAAYASGAIAAGSATPFERLRAEWHADMRELAQLEPSLGIIPPTPASAASSAHGK
jgi:fatty acid desaturase